jgi:hypothetical protein
MKYTLESTLPIDAFKPRGRRSPFAHGMTLEGGGGGFIGDAVSGIVKGATDVVKGVVQPIYNATLRNIPGVDNALVNLDKSVGKTIPGGWGTVAAVATSFLPAGSPLLMGLSKTAAATGLGALSGSGVLKKGNQFNLQGAIMGGAMAYGASNLSDAFQNAGKELAATPTGANTAAVEAIKPGSGYVPEGGMGTGSTISSVPQAPTPPPGAGYDYSSGLSADAVKPYTPPPSFAERVGTSISNIPSNIESGLKSFGESAGKVFDPNTYQGLGTKLADTASGTMSNMGDFGSGVAKVLGGSASLPSGTVMGAGIPLVIGASGMAALEEQQKYLDQQKAAGNIAQSEYDAAKAKIAEQVAYANKVVGANPLQSGTDLDSIQANQRDFALARKTDNVNEDFYLAEGGQVALPPDDQTNMASQSPVNFLHQYQQQVQQMQPAGLQSFSSLGNIGQTSAAQSTGSTPQNYYGGGAGLGAMSGAGSNNAFPLEGQYGIVKMAAGGMAPSFLSGGGDGMSDSIPAMIGNKQEARLADGEFVIPADVVSHLGNGSSKAGAKQLYSMMDKVRTARTGRKSQGKQINPRKYMPV